MVYIAVFLASFSSLAFEVLLARIFAISQWHHLAFMVISLALFGFAASGTFLSFLDARKKGWEARLSGRRPLALALGLYSIAALGAFIILNRLPLDYFRLPLAPIQALYLLTAYLALSIPFIITGGVISLAYAARVEHTGWVYFATMSGSAVGALTPALFLPLFGEGRLLVLVSLAPLVVLPFSGKGRSRAAGSAVFAAALVVAAALPADHPILKVRPSPYKALSQTLEFPKTRITETVPALRGRIDRVSSPYIRYAPGLSLQYTRPMPNQEAVFTDGDNRLVLYDVDHPSDLDFARYTLPYAGYHLSPNPERVLALLAGGGAAIPSALASGADAVSVVHPHPAVAAAIGDHYGLPTTAAGHRQYLAAADKRFSIIHLENWGASLTGSDALSQTYDFTVDAFGACLDRLTDDGLLIMSRRLLLPPSDALRLWAGAFEGLRNHGAAAPGRHIAMLRNWDTVTLVVSARPLGAAAAHLADWAREMNFDPVYLPGMTPDMANRFNQFDAPFHHREIQALAAAYGAGTEAGFFRDYPLDVAPQTDRRPFPGRILKWGELGALHKSMGSRMYAMLMSGEVVVAVVFVEALAVALLLLAAPVWVVFRKGEGASVARVLYFLGVGAGFMFGEMYYIKAYALLWGHPLISFAGVIGGLLIFSALGGALSQRMDRRAIRWMPLILLALFILSVAGLVELIHGILHLSAGARYVIGAALLLPVGLLMGIPFSLGMRHLLDTPRQRTYAWAANGCASVLAAILSEQVAVAIGIPAILGCAMAGYAAAWAASRGIISAPRPSPAAG
jgi:hypothetical protein